MHTNNIPSFNKENKCSKQKKSQYFSSSRSFSIPGRVFPLFRLDFQGRQPLISPLFSCHKKIPEEKNFSPGSSNHHHSVRTMTSAVSSQQWNLGHLEQSLQIFSGNSSLGTSRNPRVLKKAGVVSFFIFLETRKKPHLYCIS